MNYIHKFSVIRHPGTIVPSLISHILLRTHIFVSLNSLARSCEIYQDEDLLVRKKGIEPSFSFIQPRYGINPVFILVFNLRQLATLFLLTVKQPVLDTSLHH